MEMKQSDHDLVDLLGRGLGNATLRYHSAVAAALGLSVTDAKAHGAVVEAGRLTAGELAERLGVTTGAVTGVINRLERASLVRRVADTNDLRRVVVEPVPNPDKERKRATLVGPMAARIRRLVEAHDEHDRSVIANFMRAATQILDEEAPRLR